MRIAEILPILKSSIDAITPSIGRVHTTLKSQFEPEELKTELEFEHPQLGRVFKAFFVRPADGTEERATVGNAGYSIANQTFIVTGLVSVQSKGASENVLEDDFDKIRTELRKLKKLKDGEDSFHVGAMRWSGIDRISIGRHLCHTKELTLVVQQRELATP